MMKKLIPLRKFLKRKGRITREVHEDFGLAGAGGVPNFFTLEGNVKTILDQGPTNACTGFSLSQNLRVQSFKCPNPSPTWIWTLERLKEDPYLANVGVDPNDGVSVLINVGVVSESDFPINFNNFNMIPSQNLYEIASKFKVPNGYAIEPRNLTQIKTLISSGIPVSVGMLVYQSLMSLAVAKSGDVEMPSPGENCLGGHEVLVIGYDDSKQKFLLVNSWGNDFGCSGWSTWKGRGFFTLPYEYFSQGLIISADVLILT